MKEVTLKIPDNKFAFFMELTKQLGFEASVDDAKISDAHKEIVKSHSDKPFVYTFLIFCLPIRYLLGRELVRRRYGIGSGGVSDN